MKSASTSSEAPGGPAPGASDAETARARQLRQVWEVICPPRLGTRDAPPGVAEPLPQDGYPRDVAFDKGLAHRIAKEGISPRAIAPLGELIGLGAKHIAEVLDIDRGTPARQAARGQPLPRHASEGVLRLLEIEQMAHDTFETPGDARGWLNRAHPMLDGETPLQAAGTSFGADEVRSILVSIRYGGAV